MTKNYEVIKDLSVSAYEFAVNLDENIELGRHELKDGAFVAVSEYETKYRADACYEAHKKYIDVQIIISGREIISAEHIDKMHKYPCIQPFGDGDTELFEVNNDGVDHVLESGDFIILYPEDAHMPCICIGEPKTVKKAVIKIPVKE